MESLQKTIGEMMTMFQTRMSEFEDELQKVPPASSSTSSLTSEFTAFRAFIIQALNSLQLQVEVLAHSVDNLEMQGRRKILLLHGVPEVTKEDTGKVLAAIVCDKLLVKDFTVGDIRRCHRMGRSMTNKPRPILLKLVDVAVRDKIWFAKKVLKGSGMTMSEFLTKGRHDVFLAAREKFGVTQCWTKAGSVYVLGTNGTRHRIGTFADLGKIESAEIESDTTEPIKQVATAKTATTKSRRTATVKK